MKPYEQVIMEEAAKWFPDCEDLLIWAWDESVSGLCHPLSVVAAWEDRSKYPPQVRAVDEGLLRRYLEDEWRRSGLDPATIPDIEAYADASGRRAWRMDLIMEEEDIRVAVGRATMRNEDLAAWDFDWENLACPEHSKTCVISTDDGRYLYEPRQSELMSLIEELRPEPDTPSYFMLMFRNRAYIQVWMHPEGVLAEIRQWHDIRERRFTHWMAAMMENPVACRTVGGIWLAEENLLPSSIVAELCTAFLEAPEIIPQRPGAFWHVTAQGGPQDGETP